MIKIKKILIATDLSPLSFSALEKGLQIAKQCHAEVTILHFLEKGFFDQLRNKVLSPARKQLIKPSEYAEQRIKENIQPSLQKILKIKIEILSANMKPGVKIINYAKQNKMDLICLGAHGQYTFRDWFVGTTAEYIVKKTTCPVFITKKTKATSYKKILLPIDFSKASELAVEFACGLFPGSQFQVLNVGNKAYDELIKNQAPPAGERGKKFKKEIMTILMQKAKQFISDVTSKKNRFSYKIEIGYPGLVILEEAKNAGIDLVIMGTHGHTQHYYNWLGSVANRVLIEIDKDILFVPLEKTQHTKKIIDPKEDYLKRMAALTEEHFQQLKHIAKE